MANEFTKIERDLEEVRAQDLPELARPIRLDRDRDAYRGFFDFDWSRALIDQVSGGPFERIVFDLLVDWLGTSWTRQMPWLVVTQLVDLADKMMVNETLGGVVLATTRERVLKRADLPLRNPSHRRRLGSAIEDILRENQRKRRETYEPICQPAGAWAAHTEIDQFSMGLAASERSAYGSIYFAYESFVRRLILAVRPDSLPEVPNAKHIEAALLALSASDSDLVARLWTGDRVRAARLVRNSIVHNGARLDERLRKVEHGIEVVDDYLLVKATDTDRLYGALKTRAAEAVEVATKASRS